MISDFDSKNSGWASEEALVSYQPLMLIEIVVVPFTRAVTVYASVGLS